MKKIIDGQYKDKEKWNSFFDNIKLKKGDVWRNKDYRYLSEIFNIEEFNNELLDVGCSFGDGLLYLKNKCPKVTNFFGTDISKEAIDICKSKKDLNFCEFFPYDISLPLPRNYDNIICLQTIEHVEDPILVMQNLINATNNLLIVGTPYNNNREDRSHIWSFDETDFISLVDRCVLGQLREKKFLNIYYFVQKN